jgi:hypothetical protein
MRSRFVTLTINQLVGTSILAAILVAGCGPSSESRLKNDGVGRVPEIGRGYDRITDTFTNTCLQWDNSKLPAGNLNEHSTQVHSVYDTATGKGFAQFHRNLSSADLTNKLKVEGSGSIGVDVFKADGSVKVANEHGSSSLSSTFTVISKVEGMIRKFPNLSKLSYNQVGLDAIATQSPQLQQMQCGSEFVDQINFGAYYVATLKIDYKSRSQKEAVEANISMDGGGVIKISGNGSVDVNKISKEINVTFTQTSSGGNPAALPSALSQSIVECDGTEAGLKACSSQFQKAIAYASEQFPRQLMKRGEKGEYAKLGCDDSKTKREGNATDSSNSGAAVTSLDERFCFAEGSIDYQYLEPIGFTTLEYARVSDKVEAENGKSNLVAIPTSELSDIHLSKMSRQRSLVRERVFLIDADFKRAETVKKWVNNDRDALETLTRVQNTIIKQMDLLGEVESKCKAWNKGDNGIPFSPSACLKDAEAAFAKINWGGELFYDPRALEIKPRTIVEWCELYKKASAITDESRDFLMSKGTRMTMEAILGQALSKTPDDIKSKAQDVDCISVQGGINNSTSLNLEVVGNLDPLTSLETLNTVIISQNSKNSLTDVSPLAQLPRLTNINLRGLELTQNAGFADLSRLKRLKQLNISGNKLANIDFIGGFSTLVELSANDNFIGDVQDLPSPCRLVNISLTGNLEVTKVSPFLEKCPSIQKIYVSPLNLDSDEQKLCKTNDKVICEGIQK